MWHSRLAFENNNICAHKLCAHRHISHNHVIVCRQIADIVVILTITQKCITQKCDIMGDFYNSDNQLPDLNGKSDILEHHHVKELSRYLSARAEGYTWSLAFTTSHMGFSLKSLYRSLSQYEGPILLVIKDSNNVVFGAFCSCSLQQSDSFYGTGETYLFTFKDKFRRYPWTGDNLYFIKGNADSVVVGAGDGNFGLWLDEDLFHGATHKCKTFNNEILTKTEDFVVTTLECWYFID